MSGEYKKQSDITLRKKLVMTYGIEINGEQVIHIRSLDSLIMTIRNHDKNQRRKNEGTK